MGVEIVTLETIHTAFMAEQIIYADKALQDEDLTEFDVVPSDTMIETPPFVQDAIGKVISARNSE
jgi:hypothetical protein